MKARVQVNSEMKKRIEEETINAVKKELDKQTKTTTRKFFKLMCIALNEQYNFGKKRLSSLISKIAETLIEANRDEIFWEHADRIVIDQLGLQFERDYTE